MTQSRMSHHEKSIRRTLFSHIRHCAKSVEGWNKAAAYWASYGTVDDMSRCHEAARIAAESAEKTARYLVLGEGK